MSKQSYTYASPPPVVERASELLCFRSLSLQGQMHSLLSEGNLD